MRPKGSSPSPADHRERAELRRALALYEQAAAMDAKNPLLQDRVRQLQAKLAALDAAPPVTVTSRAAPEAAQGFSAAPLSTFKDPDELRRAIQAYRDLVRASPDNQTAAAKLAALEERLKAMVRPHRALGPKGSRRPRVDLI